MGGYVVVVWRGFYYYWVQCRHGYLHMLFLTFPQDVTGWASVNNSLTVIQKPKTILSTPNINVSVCLFLSLFFFLRLRPIAGVTLWTPSAWTWFTLGSRFDPRWPTSPAPASSTSSAPTSGWRPSPSRMSTPPWCSSSSTRCVTSWRPTLARSARRTSRTTLCSSTNCWMVIIHNLFACV